MDADSITDYSSMSINLSYSTGEVHDSVLVSGAELEVPAAPGGTAKPTPTPTSSPTGVEARFVYGGDGARVVATINEATTLYVGDHYEVELETGLVTKYYAAGSQLVALYAIDQPVAEATPALVKAVPGGRPSWSASRVASWGPAGALLAPGLLLLVISVGLWLFMFIAPGRLAHLLEPLPGDAYLRLGLRAAPWALLAVVLPAAAFLLLSRRAQDGPVSRPMDPGRPIRWGVALTLLASLPVLALSLAALGVFLFDPSRFQDLMAHLTQEAFLRLALVFSPAVLLSLVLLAVLFLLFSRPRPEAVRVETLPAEVTLSASRRTLAVWVLTGGLAGSAVVALGLLRVALYFVARQPAHLYYVCMIITEPATGGRR